MARKGPMGKKFLLITRTTDPVNESGRIVHSKRELNQRLKDAKSAGIETSHREIKRGGSSGRKQKGI